MNNYRVYLRGRFIEEVKSKIRCKKSITECLIAEGHSDKIIVKRVRYIDSRK